MIEDKIQRDKILAPYSTFRIGGPAEMYLEVTTPEELENAMAWSRSDGIPVTILGGGSNVLISDAGIKGLVLKIANDDCLLKGERLECGAGASLIRASRLAISNSLSGLEWAIGIPGSVGGAVRGNAGAYGLSIQDCLETAEIFSCKNGKFYKISKTDCSFNYRGSVFKDNADLLLWKAVFRLQRADAASVQLKAQEFLEKRDASQPKLPSAGCVFKNILFEELLASNPGLAKDAEECGVVKGGKVAAAWLIDRTGLKGKAIGGAKVSLEHANFIVNTGRATAAEVAMLISLIKQKVRQTCHVQLFEEVQYLGF
jgi:UDP-N-acetylmuramate dehydrogenase